MTPEQCRAARGLVDMSQARLAALARVGESTVRNFEAGRSTPNEKNLEDIREALEAAGALFIDAVDGEGPGVRLKRPPKPARH